MECHRCCHVSYLEEAGVRNVSIVAASNGTTSAKFMATTTNRATNSKISQCDSTAT